MIFSKFCYLLVEKKNYVFAFYKKEIFKFKFSTKE